MNGQSESNDKAALCRNCYTCEKGVSKDVTLDILKKDRAKRCQTCYFCQGGISPTTSIDDMVAEGTQAQESSDAQCEKCFSCESCVTREGSKVEGKDPNCANCFSCEKCVVSEGGRGALRPMGEQERAALCQNCYTCEQGVDKTVTVDNLRRNPYAQQFTYFIFPTNGCNLRCKYCYANNKPGKMTPDTLHQVLTWLFRKQLAKTINCHFFGGEPMTMWNMMQDMVGMGNELAKETGVTVTWSMTTNGTLLSQERLDWIKANFKPNNPFLLSIDGRPETHDKNRVLADGKPTHHLIPVDLILQYFPYLECRPTITPETAKDWFEDFKWLRNKGFKAIAVEPDFECDWSEEQIRDYERMLGQIGQFYILSTSANRPLRLKFIDTVLQGLQSRTPPGGTMCGTANNCAGIDHRGKLYACQRYASYNDPDKYALGDVWNGWDEFKLLQTMNLPRSSVTGDITRGYNCQTCWIKNFCHKGCNAAHCKWMQRRDIAVPMACELSRVEVKVGLMVLAELGRLGLAQSQSGAAGCGASCPIP